MRTITAHWRSALLPAFIMSAMAACGGVVLLGQASIHVAGSGVPCDGSPTHRLWTADGADGGASDADDDDDPGNDDAPSALAPEAAALPADQGLVASAIHVAQDEPSSHEMDGHLLRGPPYGLDDDPSNPAWSADDPDGGAGDADDDDDPGNDDAPSAVAPEASGLPTDRGLVASALHTVQNDPSSHEMDGHLLRGPPYGVDRDPSDPGDSIPGWTGDFNDGFGDSFDDNDDDDDGDDAPGQAVAAVSAALSGDHGQVRLKIHDEIDRRSAFASDGNSLRAPPQ